MQLQYLQDFQVEVVLYPFEAAGDDHQARASTFGCPDVGLL